MARSCRGLSIHTLAHIPLRGGYQAPRGVQHRSTTLARVYALTSGDAEAAGDIATSATHSFVSSGHVKVAGVEAQLLDVELFVASQTGSTVRYRKLDSPATNKHDELDFEFLGGGDNNNYVLQTNVFAHGYGNREQRIRLSFDPTKRFHSYKMLWNLKQIVFLVDDIPIRMFKNIPRLSYISQPLQIKGTIWQADWILPPNTKMDWRNGPFKAQYGRFNISGCGVLNCQNWTPTKDQQKAYKNVRQNLMVYDYCTDPTRFKGTIPPECKYNQ
ncbi:probable xyloglucan endotransglucosylase/hydrolase protein B [Malania oleifera]|uniref:probable xyloglucan endotransglucosylase/hydrolase protein B n=1 Tax=Malania oleifera TaxID=397392 RepID=UPI0025AE39A8|nr:probable xyloglucan endotransglucosylase/hydrolase protein B [Malania oleifera]